MSGKPGGAIQGTFPGLKSGRPVRYASTLERDLLFVLEYEQQVIHYQEQPFQIQAVLEDGLHSYTPDYAIWTQHDRLLVECKPAALLDDPHTQQQIQIGTRWAQANDWQFTVVTQDDLGRGARLANLKLLWRYSRLPVEVAICQAYRERCTHAMTIAELAQTADRVPVVLHLLFHHHLQTDLWQPLTVQSQVWC
jgi:hypothetical protein